ncbi:MAG: tRNA (adenosine(37)-N6)-threonylcarbamoyltransferase complex ATPase subunit type 1 TsaE [Gemmatimonadota bacterium]
MSRAGVDLDEAALLAWGRRLGRRARENRVFVALYGPLGAGKTTLVRAACRGAGVRDQVSSPTFALVHRHATGAEPVYHVDLYRIGSAEELAGLGWEDLLSADGPVFLEWADRAGSELPPDRWDVRLSFGSCPRTRRVEVVRCGAVIDAPSLTGPCPAGAREAPADSGREG